MAAPITGWRKLAGAAWKAPSDPQFYGDLSVDAGVLQAYVDEARRRTGAHVTVTHLVGKAVAHGLREVPELSRRLSRGREHERASIDVFFIVADGAELTGAKIAAAADKSVVEIARELGERVESIRAGDDAQLGRTKAMIAGLPRPLLRAGIRLGAFLTCDLDLDLPRLGLPREPFGAAMITSVGGWGIGHAYSPLASYYRVPLLVLVGAVEERPIAVAGRVLARPMLGLTATFDHRWCDGSQAARFSAALHDYLANPYAFEPPLGVVHLDVPRLPLASTV